MTDGQQAAAKKSHQLDLNISLKIKFRSVDSGEATEPTYLTPYAGINRIRCTPSKKRDVGYDLSLSNRLVRQVI